MEDLKISPQLNKPNLSSEMYTAGLRSYRSVKIVTAEWLSEAFSSGICADSECDLKKERIVTPLRHSPLHPGLGYTLRSVWHSSPL